MAEYIEYHPLKFWLDPASIAEIVAHIQTYLVNNPINSTTEIETIIHDYLIAHPELIGGVDSVNGETGEVVLTADNISAGETVTIKDVLDSLQDQIDDIVASIPSDYQQLVNDVSTLKSAFIEEQSASKNKLITNSVTITGNVGATRNVSGDVYLENGVTYRVQLWNALTSAFNNITSTKLTIRDTTDTTDILTIVSYTAINANGASFSWDGATGFYKFHAIVASANTTDSTVLSGGFFVYYDSLYPSTFEAGQMLYSMSAKNSVKLEDSTKSEILDTALNNAETLVSERFGDDTRYVACIGDSITAGSGASRYGASYYWLLTSALIADGSIKNRINLGLAGGGAIAIAADSGAYGLYITASVTIPADTTAVEIALNRDIKNAGNNIVEANRNNPCYLSGIEGRLSYTNSKYYFTRSENGTAKQVAAGMPLLLYGGMIALDAEIIVVFAGTNDILDTDPSDAKNKAVVDVIESMTALSKNGKYIVVSPYINSVNSDFRSALSAKFGQRFIDMYSYFSGQAVLDGIAEGIIESGTQEQWQTLLLSDGLHPNDAGHRLIYERIYSQIKCLGWT